MSAMDTEAKAYFSNAERFADAFNFLIYDGSLVLRPSELREMDTTAIVLPYGKETKQPVQKIRDVLKLYAAMQDSRAVYLVLGIEIQAAIHYAMPVRNMLYDAMNYAQQVSSKGAAHRKAKTKMTDEEFLSGFRRDDRLMPVITLVISLSPDPWDGPVSLHEMLEIEDEKLMAFVPDYRLNLLTPAQLSENDFDKFHTGLGAMLQFMKHRNDKDMSWLEGNRRFEQLDKETASLIQTVTGTDIRYDEKGATVNMWEAWENSLTQAKKDGDQQGYSRGFEQGKAELLRQLMQRNGLSSSQAMDMAGISTEDRPRYQVLLNS